MLHRAPCAFKIVDKLVRNRCGNFVANVKREEVITLENAKKSRCGPRLDQYIREGKERRYTSYRKASLFYSIPYYQLVRLAKEADACWKVRKTVIVDLDKLDVYMENFKDGGN